MSIYSERFVISRQQAGGLVYVIPAGTRAVVRSFTAVRWDASPTSVYLIVAGRGVYAWSGVQQYSSVNVDMRHVAYAGEDVQLYMSSATDAAIVSGYLFRETGTRLSPLPAPSPPVVWAPPEGALRAA